MLSSVHRNASIHIDLSWKKEGRGWKWKEGEGRTRGGIPLALAITTKFTRMCLTLDALNWVTKTEKKEIKTKSLIRQESFIINRRGNLLIHAIIIRLLHQTDEDVDFKC